MDRARALRGGAAVAFARRHRCPTPPALVAGSWVERAACRGSGFAPYFPRAGVSADPAKAVCGQCPVRGECLDFALQHPQLQGVWGGTSDADRRELRSRAV
jgi:WhiB family redox-sensing transcriptional regulator